MKKNTNDSLGKNKKIKKGKYFLCKNWNLAQFNIFKRKKEKRNSGW